MNITGKVYDAAQASAQATVQLSFKPTINNKEIFADTYYIHTYKRDLRIAPHLLHDYLPIANVLGNNVPIFTIERLILYPA